MCQNFRFYLRKLLTKEADMIKASDSVRVWRWKHGKACNVVEGESATPYGYR